MATRTRRDVLLFLPRLFSRRSTYRAIAAFPLLVAGFGVVVLGFMAMVLGFMLMCALFMVGVVFAPFLLIAALILGPRPVKGFLGRLADFVFDNCFERGFDAMDGGADRMFNRLDKVADWVEGKGHG
jgi:hypothetical protein